jgi:hypothetical protein
MEFRESSNEKRVKERAEATAATVEPEVEVEEIEEAEVVTEAPLKAATAKPKPKAVPKKAEAKPRTSSPRLANGVYALTGVIELVLLLRLVSAVDNSGGTMSNQSGFSAFIYNVADPLTRPFYDLFNTTSGHEPGVGVIVTAMIVYGLIGWGIGRLLRPSQA